MTSTLESDALTRDAFLGSRLHVLQPRKGYRAGIDPVLLAASVPAQPGQRVLDLGCGVGVAGLCLAARAGAHVTGLELQPDYAALARQNAASNGLNMDVVEGGIQDMPADLRAQSFDHVIANPPYYDRRRGTDAANAGREAALGEKAPLADWLDAAVRRLKPKAILTFIQRADRLSDLLAGLDSRTGDICVLPISARAGRSAELVIIRARKGARGPLRLLAPLVLHQGAQHDGDKESYHPAVNSVLRDGAALEAGW